jgi:hypothetical protein
VQTTAAKSTGATPANLPANYADVPLGGASDTWGRSWTVDELADGKFKIVVSSNTSATAPNELDCIGVEVFTQVPTPTRTATASPTATATPTATPTSTPTATPSPAFCTSDATCNPATAFCEDDASCPPRVPSTCHPKGAAGDCCDRPGECQSGLNCSGSPGICVAGP